MPSLTKIAKLILYLAWRVAMAIAALIYIPASVSKNVASETLSNYTLLALFILGLVLLELLSILMSSVVNKTFGNNFSDPRDSEIAHYRKLLKLKDCHISVQKEQIDLLIEVIKKLQGQQQT